jgi:hypothetical protein
MRDNAYLKLLNNLLVIEFPCLINQSSHLQVTFQIIISRYLLHTLFKTTIYRELVQNGGVLYSSGSQHGGLPKINFQILVAHNIDNLT